MSTIINRNSTISSSSAHDMLNSYKNTDTQSDSKGFPKYEEEQNEAEEDEYLAPGYISVKDYGYSTEDPLHYGYYYQNEEEEYSADDEVNDVLYDYYNEDDAEENFQPEDELVDSDPIDSDSDLQNKRQSYILPSDCIINKQGMALYDFESENENEMHLQEGQIVFINYRHGQGWLVVETLDGISTGLVPEDYLQILDDDEVFEEQDMSNHESQLPHTYENSDANDGITDSAKRPEYLAQIIHAEQSSDKKPSLEQSAQRSSSKGNDTLNEEIGTLNIH